MKKLRVLMLTRNLPPLLGGMENLNFRLAQGLSEHSDLSLVGPEASVIAEDRAINFMAVTLKPLWRFLVESLLKGVGSSLRQKPDVVLGGSGLMAVAVWSAAKVGGARSVLYVHGLDLIVPHPVYQAVWGWAIRRVDCVICNSQPTALLARQLGVEARNIRVICPGVDVSVPPVSTENMVQFRQRFGFGQRSLLLSVGRLTARKGLSEFVQFALPDIAARIPDVLLVVIGDAPSDALHATPQRKEDILALAQAHGVADSLVFLGRVDDATLQCAYGAGAVHVFPVRDIPGDPEGFGMVAIEAAAHGLPTVAFRSGGVTDSVAEGRSGYLVEPEDYAQFARRVCEVLASPDVLRASSIEFAQQFAWPEFNARIRACLEQVCGRSPDASAHTSPDVHP